MNALQNRWIYVGAVVAATLTGCDGVVVDCDEEPDARICQDDPEEDASEDEEDAEVVRDGGTRLDGGKDAGTPDASKDGAVAPGIDASSPDADVSAPITIDQFCVEQLATAVLWRDALEALCNLDDQAARDEFLERSFAYAKDDAEGKCITTLKGVVNSGNATFDGTRAQACADAFRASFAPPPDPFPADGIDLSMYAAKIAHGAPVLAQIPVCRATFKGKLTRDKPCTDNFECLEGLRCLPAPGNTVTCQPPITIGTCVRTSNCADGSTCVGSDAAGGRTCVKSDSLPLMGGNCALSLECGEGLICSSGKCANPTPQLICKP